MTDIDHDARVYDRALGSLLETLTHAREAIRQCARMCPRDAADELRAAIEHAQDAMAILETATTTAEEESQ